MKSKKPPDLPFYKCIKCPIKNIIKDDNKTNTDEESFGLHR